MSKRKKNNKLNIYQGIIGLAVVILVTVFGYIYPNVQENTRSQSNIIVDLSTIPEYDKSAYVEINGNIPYFTEEEYTTENFEKYSEWDSLGRSGVAFANICKEIMPKDGEERGEIGSVKDLSGWVQKRYDNIIKDKYLYNRCHLIGWQLAGENANKKNLITGTRYLNTEGMLQFENIVAEYIKSNPDYHVLYRVTPIFEGNNKLASGVQIEANSVENREDVRFNVYVYNVQPRNRN